MRQFVALSAVLAIMAVLSFTPAYAVDTAAPRYIGQASMLPDKTIILNLIRDQHGVLYHDELRYSPGDTGYEEVLAHLGGMSPGDWKSVTPFVDGR